MVPPSNLAATAGDHHVTLAWTAGSGTTFIIRRSTVQGGPHTTIAHVLGSSISLGTGESAVVRAGGSADAALGVIGRLVVA